MQGKIRLVRKDPNLGACMCTCINMGLKKARYNCGVDWFGVQVETNLGNDFRFDEEGEEPSDELHHVAVHCVAEWLVPLIHLDKLLELHQNSSVEVDVGMDIFLVLVKGRDDFLLPLAAFQAFRGSFHVVLKIPDSGFVVFIHATEYVIHL